MATNMRNQQPLHPVTVAELQWIIAQVENLEANINALLLGASGKIVIG
jgi:hypothetical protein